MKPLFLALLFFTNNLFGLDAAAIRKLAAEPHSRENLIEELKLYPNAREYKITIQAGPTANALEARPEFTVTGFSKGLAVKIR